jgi:hypothetical protein
MQSSIDTGNEVTAQQVPPLRGWRQAVLAKYWPVLALFAAAVLLVSPLWLADSPAMPDYPAHLASFYLLAGGAKAALLAQFYAVHWVFVPNLAAEILVPPLAHLMPLATATKMFLTLAVAMWVLGAGAVQKALYGRVGLAPLAASFFAYNANFMWGFFNYCFATALSFVVFAAWIASPRSPSRLAGFCVAITIVYFCHVFAAATLFVMIACYELAGLRERREFPWPDAFRRAAIIVALYIPSALAFLVLKPKGAGVSHVEFNLIDTFLDRVSAAVQYTFDRPAYFLLLALVAFLAMGLWRRRIVLHPHMRLLLAVLLATSLLVPEWAMGGWGVDLRLPAVLGTLAFAAADMRFARRTTALIACTLLGLLVYQAATLAGNWRYYDRQFAEFRATIAGLEPGSKLVTVLDGDAMGLAADQPYWHMAEYAIVARSAFTPLLFATKGQHVIQIKPAFRSIAATSAQQGSPPDISELDDLSTGDTADDPDIGNIFPYLIRFQCHFDDAVVIHLGGRRSAVPDMLSLRHAGSFFSLYRISRTADCGKS